MQFNPDHNPRSECGGVAGYGRGETGCVGDTAAYIPPSSWYEDYPHDICEACAMWIDYQERAGISGAFTIERPTV